MQTIDNLNTIVSNYFESNKFEGNPAELYDPINYILGLGGKRVRPLMVLMSYKLFKDDVEKALPLAQAIEVFHNFTLIHDDIMDKAPLRRGEETVHIKWDDNIAILSGDAMLIKAYQLLEELESSQLKTILPVFSKTAIEVCEGQQYDMNFETRNDVTIDQYVEMISLKTSVLLGAAMKIGALGADAEESEANFLYDFGKFLGLAFQLQDDYLDLYGDPNKFGKRIGGDVVANKKTFLTLKAFLKADKSTEQELKELFSTNNLNFAEEEKKINRVREIFTALDVVDNMKEEINKYYNNAIIALYELNVEENKKEELLQFAQNLIKRDV
ncbi:MAG: polyprenyl synthetase family protein [Flavobacteriales bacterium]|nr:polyprenyl synthetase family protein [Flavobacteriales bacterium]